MKQTSCCCTCSATPRKSSISCDPEAKLGKRNSGGSEESHHLNIEDDMYNRIG
ncbi:hypothetical protein FXV91_10835 [Methanosarcina sp. DH2]|uniref:hypothetical protein n=1 Tax=Methanosarcina sp. DH2 TaxID=2605639 RepID=UPI001E59F19C|nr:hypothetical protein [Methanosarcina sp. DH2]MCC4770659.1 hypothetical protein [Methanosarcina sp. DH2]